MTTGTTRKCPWCAEEVFAEARKCKHCGELLGGAPDTTPLTPANVEPVWKFTGRRWRCLAHNSQKCAS